jgi:uncharacterized protein YoxC
MIYVQLAGAVALLALAVLISSFVPAAFRLKDTVESMDKILGKLETTVDEVNAELAKVNETTESVQKAVSKIENISSLLQETVSSPLIKVASYGAGLTGAMRSFRGGRQKGK